MTRSQAAKAIATKLFRSTTTPLQSILRYSLNNGHKRPQVNEHQLSRLHRHQKRQKRVSRFSNSFRIFLLRMKVPNEKVEVAANFKNLSLFEFFNFVKMKNKHWIILILFHDFKAAAAETWAIKINSFDILSWSSKMTHLWKFQTFRMSIFTKKWQAREKITF